MIERRLFEFLSALALETKSIEDIIAKARSESGEKLQKRIGTSRSELQQKIDEFIRHVEKVNSGTKEGWELINKTGDQKVEQYSAGVEANEMDNCVGIEESIHELSLESAERQYTYSVEYAACCIQLASVALSEVESATLESFEAKQRLEALKRHLNN